ncbi:hypothetical protein BVY03_06055 [bacterium K02(2017)]|nr:hypothetical protein BVY03_06055 [bacterium K02(2017)]
MQKNFGNKAIISFFVFFIISLLSVVSFNYYIDPFGSYGTNHICLSKKCLSEFNLNIFLAKEAKAKNILLGSSLSHRSNLKDYSQAAGMNVLNLAGSFNTAAEQKKLIEIAAKETKLESVYWELYTNFIRGPEFIKTEIPYYLFDKSPLNDFKYLASIDTIKASFTTLTQPSIYDLPLIGLQEFNTCFDCQYGKKHVLNKLPYILLARQNYIDFNNLTAKSISQSLNKDILASIDAHPQTNFTFFFPPVSIYDIIDYNNRMVKNNNFSIIEVKRLIAKKLLIKKNVKIVDFQLMENFITDLNNYSDLLHFKPQTNNYIAKNLNNPNYQLNLPNLEQRLATLNALMIKYNSQYDKFLKKINK